MKEKGNKKNLAVDIIPDFPDSDQYDNQELVLSDCEEDNFYSILGDDNNKTDRDKIV